MRLRWIIKNGEKVLQYNEKPVHYSAFNGEQIKDSSIITLSQEDSDKLQGWFDVPVNFVGEWRLNGVYNKCLKNRSGFGAVNPSNPPIRNNDSLKSSR